MGAPYKGGREKLSPCPHPDYRFKGVCGLCEREQRQATDKLATIVTRELVVERDYWKKKYEALLLKAKGGAK